MAASTTSSGLPVSEGSSRFYPMLKRRLRRPQSEQFDHNIGPKHSAIQQPRQAGRNPFRAQAFGGGVAMMVLSNALSVLDQFFSFHFTGALIAVYGLLWIVDCAVGNHTKPQCSAFSKNDSLSSSCSLLCEVP